MRTLKRILGAVVAGAGLVAAMALTASAQPDYVTGVVHADGGLNGRIAPSVHTDVQYVFPDGAEVTIDCQTKGTIVGDNAVWYLIVAEGDAKWVSARYVELTGDEPGWCGDSGQTISVKITEDTYSHQGPSTSDDKVRLQHAGGGQAVLCYAYTSAGGNDRWVVTLEDGWVPADKVESSEEIPFCQH